MSEPQRKSDPGDYFKSTSVAENYDRYIGTNIPYYRSAINTICKLLSDMHGKSAPDLTAIEFGSGTGNVTVSLLQQVGIGKVLMVDHSQGMLTVALEKVRQLGLPKTAAIALEAAILDDDWKYVIGFERPDIVLFHLALDHVESDADLKRLLGDIYEKLSIGGTLVLAEKCADGQDRESPSWKSFAQMVDHRASNLLNAGLMSVVQTQDWRRHLLVDDVLRPLSVLRGFAENAGFRVTDVFGVPLPPHGSMTYDMYYESKSVQRLDHELVASAGQAFGVGILFCRKKM